MTSSTTLRQGLAAIAGLLLFAGTSLAQDNPELGDIDSGGGGDIEGGGEIGGDAGGGATWSAPTTSSSGQGYATPTPAASSEVDDSVAPGDTDHSQFVERMGIGYFGVMQLPTCVPGFDPAMGGQTGCRSDVDSLAAPSIGARYWLDADMAVEGALGFHMSSGETKTTTTGPMGAAMATTVEDPSFLGFALHLGVPLMLADTRHVAFQAVPQLNFGFASGSWKRPGAMVPETDASGMLFELGSTIGTEIHFGFIDLPNLALQANVGLMLRYESRKAENFVMAAGGTATEYETSGMSVSTGIGNDPWDIFTGGVTAIYYL